MLQKTRQKLRQKDIRGTLKRWFPVSWRDSICLVIIMTLAALMCAFLRSLDDGEAWVHMVFVLGVLFTSRCTTGYLYGLLASIVGVFGANYAFTYPYMELDFTQPGYMFTFLCMTVVSVTTSVLTTRIKLTERLRAEAETEKMRSNLLRAVSHDLRTPLTSIVGASAVLLEDEDQLSREQRNALLQGVNSDAKWLIRVMENLLSITRIGGENTCVNKEYQAAEEVLAEAVQKFRKIFPDRHVSVRVPQELLMVPMDAVLIEQVLLNLMENVVDHGGPDAKIVLSAAREGKDAVFRVQDNGVGIEKSVLNHLFQPGYQPPHSASADGRRNMGIGLSVCLSIVKAHGGTMTARNLEEGGAEMRFTLPIDEEEELYGIEG